MSICRATKCVCKKFTSSNSDSSNCDCGHSQSQHSNVKAPDKALPTANKVKPAGPRASVPYNKPLPAKDKPLPKKEATDENEQKVSSFEKSSGFPVANTISVNEESGQTGKRLSVSNRTSRLPSTHQYSKSATLSPSNPISIEKTTPLQASATIAIQPKPSTTTMANHTNNDAFANANAALKELKEYLSECKEESTHLMDLENDWNETYNNHVKSMEASFEELHEQLRKRQNSLKEEIDGLYQHKMNEIQQQKGIVQTAIQDLSKTMEFCEKNVKNESEVKHKIKTALSQVPQLYKINTKFEDVPFHMNTLQWQINQIGVHSFDSTNTNGKNNSSNDHNVNKSANNNVSLSSVQRQTNKHEKQPSAPVHSLSASHTQNTSQLLSNQDMKALVSTMFGQHDGSNARRTTAANYQAPAPVETISELTPAEMASYGFSDEDEDSDDEKKKLKVYRGNVRTDSNADEKSPSAGPVKANPIALKDVWDGDEDSDED